ncbi:uncharacterized protein LOC129968703 [Argiope bruennichi]|uniref:uncharacterized protein LOC129968703 n=1 Tax=Argiope bruennichi TaxID=94029 RepID=UPI0024951ECB|nr:uncharacterized protein LOC129968703 [Argiope bruennichi]
MCDIEIDTEFLIALVKERPILWDKTGGIYRDRHATRMAWKEICILLKDDFQTSDVKEKYAFRIEVTRRWYNIRDAFAKFCKKDRELKKSGTRVSKLKKYIYHDQLKFLSKFYTTENVVENCEDERENNDISRPDTSKRSDSGKEDELTSAEAKPIQLSDSIKDKRSNESEFGTSRTIANEKSNRHLCFFKGVIPFLEEFSEQEVVKFKTGVLQLIANIKDQRHGMPHAQVPAPFLSFSTQHGSSGMPSSTTMYHPLHHQIQPFPIHPFRQLHQHFWSAVCPICNAGSINRY